MVVEQCALDSLGHCSATFHGLEGRIESSQRQTGGDGVNAAVDGQLVDPVKPQLTLLPQRMLAVPNQPFVQLAVVRQDPTTASAAVPAARPCLVAPKLCAASTTSQSPDRSATARSASSSQG